MALDVTCPFCGESDDLAGERAGDQIAIVCGACGQSWERPTTPVCAVCQGNDLQPVPLAIVERSRSCISVSSAMPMTSKGGRGIGPTHCYPVSSPPSTPAKTSDACVSGATGLPTFSGAVRVP
jgi:hypothetical protein